MEVVSNNYMPGDPRLVQQIVYELKSQGIFDQFRKECIADVDTKPAYQNLRQRVEGSVSSFLSQKVWSPDMNKNQVREQLRKSIHESGYLDIGVERIVDQVVNPKINTIFLPQVEDVIYRYLGVQKPLREIKKDLKIDIEDLLPTDLEAVSPESVHSYKNDSKMEDASDFDNSMNKQIDEDESPPFEPLDNQPTIATTHEENSVDSHLSGFSGLQSHDNSNHESDTKIYQMDISSQDCQDSQTSQNSSESHLSIVTSDETVMVVGDESKLTKSKEVESETVMSDYFIQTSDNMQTLENVQHSEEIQTDDKPPEEIKKIEPVKNIDNTVKNLSEKKPDKKNHSRKSDEKKTDDKKSNDKKYDSKKSDKHTDEKKSDEKKSEKRDDKKSRSSDKYISKDKKDDKYKKSSSKSKDREKSNSRHSSSSSKEKDTSTKESLKDKDSSSLMKEHSSVSRGKTKIKDKKEYKSSSSNKEKGDKERNKDKGDKDKSVKDKNRFDKPKGKSDKDFKDKEKSDKDKDKYDKKKEKSDKDRHKTSSSSGSKHSSSTSSKDKSSSSSKKDKYRSSSSDSKDKLKIINGDSKSCRSDIKSSSELRSSTTDVKSSNRESKSKSSDNYKKEEKQPHMSSSSKKSKKRDSKKQSKDDHYSSKDKKTDRRSTDRDSNDGHSNKQIHSNSFTESTSSCSQKKSNDSSSISGSGTNDSGNSDRVEQVIKLTEVSTNNNDIQKLKYVKPKLASNFQEAIKIMKIRKQLAKLERQNQLSLARIDLVHPVPNGVAADIPNNIKENHTKRNNIYTDYIDKAANTDLVNTLEEPACEGTEENISPKRDITPLKTTDLSKENWEALEARLAQEMSNVNCSSYESYDDYDYSGSEVIVSPKKNIDTNNSTLLIEQTTLTRKNIVLNLEDKFEETSKEKLDSDESKNDETLNSEVPDREIKSSEEIFDTRHNMYSINSIELNQQSNDLKIQSSDTPKNSEKSNGTHPQVHKIEETELKECLFLNEEEEDTIAPVSIESNQLVTELPLDIQYIDEHTPTPDSMCRYLEKPSPSVQRNIQFIYQFVKKLEGDVEHCIKASQNNFLPTKRGKKRKCELYVDLKNNNKGFYEQLTVVKKRGRPPGSHSNTAISKANKDKTRNSTDISPNERFSLPLSPAESDKSTDKKEDIKTVQQKTNKIKTPTLKKQRYSSEDLYKPRPVIGRSRRSRCAKTSD